METMHAAGRRRLPPVPRIRPRRPPAAPAADEPADLDGPSTERFALDTDDAGPTTERFVMDPPADAGPVTERFEIDLSADGDDETDAVPVVSGPPSAVPETPTAPESDAAQDFVARLRSAAAEFAEAAGAASAVVREAVPPARHRRARCRVVLRYADDTESDVTFLGPAGAPGAHSRHGFDRQIRRWLGSGQRRADAWVVADPEAPDGLAVDVTAWLAAS